MLNEGNILTILVFVQGLRCPVQGKYFHLHFVHIHSSCIDKSDK